MAQPIRLIAPGIVHWAALHPTIDEEVSSYLLTDSGVVFDPMVPPEGLDWFDEQELRPRDVLLSCRHHLRDAPAFVDRFGCAVHAARPGMHEFSAADGVTAFDFGDVLAGDVRAIEIDAISPDETAFHVPDAHALVIADGIINAGGLTFVPDEHLGDDPVAVKRGLKHAFLTVLEDDAVDFDHLLFAHGEPIVGEGRVALRDFLAAL